MFMMCIKKKTLIYYCIGIMAVVVLIAGMVFFGGEATVSTTEQEKVSELSDIIVKIGSYGYQVEQQPVEIEQITVPEDFNEVYEKYNEMQESQGFDLKKYKGKDIKRFCFKVTNYKEVVKDNKFQFDEVFVNVFVYKNKIIAGEIFSNNLNGFMHTFDGKNYYQATTTE